MKKLKYCETLKKGFYLLVVKELGLNRCVYCTGTTKGNKWIEMNEKGDGEWVGLFWNCISKVEIEESVYSIDNPTSIDLKI